jgi:hypothetical protein
MPMRIRVTTRADLYEKRKREHIELGYRIEDERPIPVNGFSSFIAVRELPVSDKLAISSLLLSMQVTLRVGTGEVPDVAQNTFSFRWTLCTSSSLRPQARSTPTRREV